MKEGIRIELMILVRALKTAMIESEGDYIYYSFPCVDHNGILLEGRNYFGSHMNLSSVGRKLRELDAGIRKHAIANDCQMKDLLSILIANDLLYSCTEGSNLVKISHGIHSSNKLPSSKSLRYE